MTSLDTARRLIVKNGEIVTYRANRTGTITDDTKPWRPSVTTPIETDVKAVPISKSSIAPDFEHSAGMAIVAGEKLLLIAGDALQSEPKINDEVEFKEEFWTVTGIEETRDKGVIALYELEIKK